MSRLPDLVAVLVGVCMTGCGGRTAPSASPTQSPPTPSVDVKTPPVATLDEEPAAPPLPQQAPTRSVRARGGVVFAWGRGWRDARPDELPLRGRPDARWVSVDPVSLELRHGTAARGDDGTTTQVVATSAARLHRCVGGQLDEGFVVACVVRAGAARLSAVELDDQGQRAAIVAVPQGFVTAFSVAADDGREGVAALGYLAGDLGVVVRAEASHLSGELGPQLSLSSASRKQAVSVFPTWRHRPHRPWVDPFD